MPLMSLSSEGKVKKHGKVFHVHGRNRFIFRVITRFKRVGNRVAAVEVGHLCAYCGFTPNESTQAEHEAAIQTVLKAPKMAPRGSPHDRRKRPE